MATPPGFADCSVQLTHALMSRPAYVTFGVDPSETDPNSVANYVYGACVAATSLLSLFDSQVTISNVRVSLGTDGGEDSVGQFVGTGVGGKSGTAVPPNCAVLIHKVTSRGGRRGRGRMFLPWAAANTDIAENGIVSGALVTTIQTAVNNFRSALATAQMPMVLLHQVSAPGTVAPTQPGPPNVVTSLVVDKLVSTQRRRLGR